MRICLLTASVNRLGGAEIVVRKLAGGLSRRGHDVQVICLDDAGDESGPVTYRSISSRATGKYDLRESRSALYKAWWQWRCRRNPALLSPLIEAVQRFRPDVIHTHKVRGFPTNLWQALDATGPGVLVHTCHDVELMTPVHELRLDKAGFLLGKSLQAWSAPLKADSRYPAVVTAPSRFLLGLHSDSGFFPGARHVVIPNFADTGFTAAPARLNQPADEDAIRLLFLGRLVKAKGVLNLCDAMRSLPAGQCRMQLTIAGDGPLRAQVERIARDCEEIQYVGVVTGSRKMELLAQSQLVVAPSGSDESFCISAAEGIASGRPALVSDRGALPEVVEDGVSGWVCNGDDRQALLDGLLRVANDRTRFPEFSENCLARRQRFSPGQFLDAYERLYGERQ